MRSISGTESHFVKLGCPLNLELAASECDEAIAKSAVDENVVVERDLDPIKGLIFEAHEGSPCVGERSGGGDVWRQPLPDLYFASAWRYPRTPRDAANPIPAPQEICPGADGPGLLWGRV